jgi:hypothetical protein
MPGVPLPTFGAAEEPEPGGHAVLLLLVPVLLFNAVELLPAEPVELSDEVLPIWSQPLSRLELSRVEALPDTPALGAVIELVPPGLVAPPALEDCAAATPTVSARTEAAVRRRRVIPCSLALQS